MHSEPRLRLHQVASPNRGAGHIEGTAALTETGNAGIAGHRDGFFRVLKDIEIDRDIYLDVAGRSLRYRVVDAKVGRVDEGQADIRDLRERQPWAWDAIEARVEATQPDPGRPLTRGEATP